MSPRELARLKTEKDNIFPKPTSDSEAWEIVRKHILGEDWYSVNPIHKDQINTEALMDILIRIPSAKYNRLSWYERLKINLIVIKNSFLGGKRIYIHDYY